VLPGPYAATAQHEGFALLSRTVRVRGAPDKETVGGPAGPPLDFTLTRDAPALAVAYADSKKPSLKLSFTNSGLSTPPGFSFSPTPDPTFTPKKGAFKAAAVAGDWEVVVDVNPDVKTVEIKVFKSEAEAKAAGAKPLVTQKIWFQAVPSAGVPPQIMTTPVPDRSGKLGTPFLDVSGPKFAALSDKRKRVIRDFLPKVFPSTVGSAAFDHLQTKSDVDATIEKLKPRFYTTCGTVPLWLSRDEFKEKARPDRFKMGGLIGCFWAAHDSGGYNPGSPAWVTAVAGATPKPGDIFIIATSGTTPDAIAKIPAIETTKHKTHPFFGDSFECLHIGVVVDPSPGEVTAGGFPIWIVAEAGQGTQTEQKALYDAPVLHADASGAPLLSGRRLAGWVDIDNYVPWV